MTMKDQLNSDDFFMQAAVAQSKLARLLAPPNPWVGCVIVKEEQIVGKGYTQTPGQEHAEIMALREAGMRAKGATVYVTLEPCAHFGKTPPCVAALIESKVSRIVIGLQDPDPQVNGKGIKLLIEAGIDVKVGTCRDEIIALLEPYLYHRKTGHPFCIAKVGISIDGKIAAGDGTSKWITSNEARQDAHLLRAESQAIIIGAGTAMTDLPRLTVRGLASSSFKPPIRVIMDARGNVSATTPLFNVSEGPILVLTTEASSKEKRKLWLDTGADVHVLQPSPSHQGVDLHSALALLGKLGVVQALFEGGGTLIGSLWKSGLMNQLTTYIGPCLLGETGWSFCKGLEIKTINDAPRLKLKLVKQINDCIRLDYTPKDG